MWTALLLLLSLFLGPPAPAAFDGLDTAYKLDAAPGGITITPDREIIISLHQFFFHPWRVAMIGKDGDLTPFPNAEWNAETFQEASTFDSVLGMRAGEFGVVWMLDNGLMRKTTPKLVGWHTKVNRLEKILYLGQPITRKDSFVKDLVVDTEGRAIYIADPAGGDDAALIVVDLRTGLLRRVLEGYPCVTPEKVSLLFNGKALRTRQADGKLIEPRMGVCSIALDTKHRWLYFGPMHGTSLYRVRTRDLLNPDLSDGELGGRVERYSSKPISDGIAIDNADNIYVTEIGANAIGVIDNHRQYQRMYQDAARLKWPCSLTYHPNGYFYVTTNQLNGSFQLNAGAQTAAPPFLIVRFKPLAPGEVGH